ncbi:MAG TPA: class I SAM-dependent methyltransferase [Acidimicrobiales bacterium]|nr:class I SAM-dependent methyltransferase [Acidimicrobiales bacterium]
MGGIDDREHHKRAPVPATGRPSIYECRQPPVDLGDLLDEHLPALRGASVLDAGCGPGAYVPATSGRAASLTALDLAAGRLRSIDPAVARRVCGDVQALPFRDATFDVVMAMHMLYHVPDIRAAAREMRRVLRPRGVLYGFTNSERAQWELAELLERNGCNPSAGGDFLQLRFSNENGAELLAESFDDVTLVELTDSELVVPDPEQIIDEVERNRYLYEAGLRPGLAWPDFVERVRREVRAVVAREGAFRMGENHGLFICR